VKEKMACMQGHSTGCLRAAAREGRVCATM
jgi:hypothetical protein